MKNPFRNRSTWKNYSSYPDDLDAYIQALEKKVRDTIRSVLMLLAAWFCLVTVKMFDALGRNQEVDELEFWLQNWPFLAFAVLFVLQKFSIEARLDNAYFTQYLEKRLPTAPAAKE